MNKSVRKLVELRVIAGLGGIGSGVPLLFLRGMSDPMPALATLTGHSGLVIFVVSLITWMFLFRWLRTRHSSDGWMFSTYGGVLGATPGLIYSVANFFATQPAPLLAMTVAGLLAGAFAGRGIQRWADGLPASRPTTP